MGSATTPRLSVRALAILVLGCCCALALASGAHAGSIGLDTNPINVGPITVTNGVATLSGNVAGSDGTSNLTVNGQPVGIDATGAFDANVTLNGQSQIELVLDEPATGEQTMLSIPLSLAGPGGTIPATVLDPLRQAGIEVTVPPGGPVSVDGSTVTLEGRVDNPSALLSLTVNGQQVQPGPGGNFTATVPAGTREFVIVATGTNGVSQTTTLPVTQLSSTISTSQGTSVSASGADGVVIARIAYQPNPRTQRVRIVVTVRDRRGFLVRDAVVRVRGVPARTIVAGATATTTNRVGRATLVLKPRASLFGRRLTTRTIARTPSATTTKTSAVKLPRLAR